MQLVRLDSNPHRKEDQPPKEHREESFRIHHVEGDFPVDESSRLRTVFSGFGEGDERRPSFAVELTWLDVKNFIQEFAEIGHPHATHLQKVLKLSQLLAETMNDEPPEFSDGLMPQNSTSG